MTIRKQVPYTRAELEALIEQADGLVYPVAKQLGISIYLIYRETGRRPSPRPKKLTPQDFEITDPQSKPLYDHSRPELMALLKKHGTKARLCRATGWKRWALEYAFNRCPRELDPSPLDSIYLTPELLKEMYYYGSGILKMRELRQKPKEEIEALYHAAGSLEVLADDLKVSLRSIKKLIKEKGIARAKQGLDHATIDGIVQQYQAGVRVRDICNNLHVHRTTVYDYLKKQNVPLRNRKVGR